MKTSYILKTSSDLTFEFHGFEELIVNRDELTIYDLTVEEVFEMVDNELPLIVEIDDTLYTINYFSKVKQI